MDLLASTGTPLLLVNLVFAGIALAVGFAAGAWVCSSKTTAPALPQEPLVDDALKRSEQLAEERAILASDRLRDLAASVASDVGSHSASIGAIEAELASHQEGGEHTAEAVLQALSQIEAANQSLQTKLAKAESQIQAQAELIRTHESEARTDSLTGLSNRRAFDDELTRRFSEWERRGTPFSLLILDVDHFKKFNDTHGHQAGDEVLRQVGLSLSDCARDMDLACRYGGEEFAIVMPATVASDGATLAERVRSAIESLAVEFEGKTLSVTVSLGLAGVESGDCTSRLVKRADAALYASKDAGRNNAHRHTGAECVSITPGRSQPPLFDEEGDESAETAVDLAIDTLPNRTRFFEMLQGEVRIAQDSGVPLSLLSAEFSGYQQLVDEFGGAVARLTLDSIAQFLDNALHEEDCLGRLSENQFVVMMPRQTAADAAEAGARINAALSKCSVPLGDGELHLATAMCATELRPDDTAVALMARAEESLVLASTESVEPALV